MKDEREGSLILEAGDMARVQKNQLFRAEEQMGQFHRTLDAMSEQGAAQDQALEEMMAWMRAEQSGLEPTESAAVTPYEAQEVQADIQMTRLVPLLKEDSWEEYLASAQWYAQLEQMDLSTDPYVSLLSKKEQEDFIVQVREDYYERKAHCDATDYALSAFCGTVAGLIDVFLVGTPGDSVLGKWTDTQTDKCIIKVAKMLGWNPKTGNENSPGHAIDFLERKFPVNYDASSTNSLGPAAKEVFNLTPKNHHIKNLAHSPDLVGLFFSILDQFTGSIHFIDKGRLISFDKEKQQLSGNSFLGKILAGFCNWLGHCASDVAGSSDARKPKDAANKNPSRGMGLSMPGFELFQFLHFGKIGPDKLTLADFSVKVFENGYDFRFGMALSIPVALNEAMTRLCFALKRYYYHHLPLNECIPTDIKGHGKGIRQPELRRMLLVAHGTMCVWDAGDAAVSYVTTQDPLNAALHLNYFAYIRLAQAGLSELRAMYRQNHIDLQAITEDTKEEWDRLYLEGQKWAPAALPE